MPINSTKKTACIIIEAEQKGFLIAIAGALQRLYDYEIRIVVRNKYVEYLVNQLLPQAITDIVVRDASPKSYQSDIVLESVELEKKYNFLISNIISEDRALGQGYLFNVQCVPDVIRASWSHERKLSVIVNEIKIRENFLSGCSLVIQQWPNKLTSIVARCMGANVFSLVNMKLGNRYFWTDKDYLLSTKFEARLLENLNNKTIFQNLPEYQLYEHGQISNQSVRYSYCSALLESLKTISHDTKYRILRRQKRDSYRYLGWLPSRFRKVRNYKYVSSLGVVPSELHNYRIVFFPLQMEPEVSLLYYSPEFNNTMEAITWISKSLPADTILVLKEQAKSFAVRSRWYYKQLNKIGNVWWANPTIHSSEWINSAQIVATITGTAAIEAIHMDKPVISFGIHQAVNCIPTVYYASNYLETKAAVKHLLSYNQADLQDFELECSRTSFLKAQIDSSFELPEYQKSFKSEILETNAASVALNNLFSEYPYLSS